MGAAAAMQAFKKFTSSGSSGQSTSGGGGGQSALIGMAMAEAAKVRFSLFQMATQTASWHHLLLPPVAKAD